MTMENAVENFCKVAMNNWVDLERGKENCS